MQIRSFGNSTMRERLNKIKQPINIHQEGVTLIVVMAILMVLTTLGLASMTDNRMQSVMVRNNQFKLEAFNASYTEINAQVGAINSLSVSQDTPDYLNALININGTSVSSETSTLNVLSEQTGAENDIDKKVTMTSVNEGGACIVTGDSLNFVRCIEIEIEVESDINNTSIKSKQFQSILYKTREQS